MEQFIQFTPRDSNVENMIKNKAKMLSFFIEDMSISFVHTDHEKALMSCIQRRLFLPLNGWLLIIKDRKLAISDGKTADQLNA